MKNDADSARSRSRSRKKAASPAPPVVAAPSTPPAPAPAPFKNVGPLESAFSLTLGVLVVIAALFPRSLKQLLLLGFGGGLVYRGMTSHCGMYQALGLDTEKGSLIKQVNDKYLAAGRD